LEISPSATFPYDAMGKIYLKQRKLELADSMFNIAIKRIPAWTEPQNSLGENYLRQNKDTNAINQYENIIQLEPKLALGYNKIGKIYTEAGAYSKAEDYFRFSLKADSLNSITYSLYSNLQILRGRYYEADKIIENALSINPKDFETNKNKANLQLLMYEKVDIDQNYLTKAHEHYQKLIEFYPYNDESYTLLSNYYIKLLSFQQTEIPYSICNLFSSDSCKVKVLNEIESLCTKALELNPFSTEAYNGLAYVNHSRNANDEALQFFQRGIDVDKINPSGYYNFGLFYMGKNDTKNAIKYFKQAIEKDTKFLPAYIDLWNIYSAQKNNAALDSLYKVTTEIFYDSPIFFHKNGTREDDKNINDIERAIEIDPQYLYSEISKENIGYNKNSSKNEEASAKIVEKLGFSFKRNDKFFDKFLVVEKNDKRGIMHINGELIIPFSFDSIIVIDPETICAIKNDTLFSHTLYWYNSIGKITTYQSKIEDYWYDEECFVFKRKDSKYACFDKYNNQILGYEFDGITPFNPKNNLLKVQMGNNFGCYNRQGKVVIKILFKQIDALNAYGVEGCRCITKDNKTQEFNNTGTPMTY
jgi:tetratricopeptide (TPR) repeat protein